MSTTHFRLQHTLALSVALCAMLSLFFIASTPKAYAQFQYVQAGSVDPSAGAPVWSLSSGFGWWGSILPPAGFGTTEQAYCDIAAQQAGISDSSAALCVYGTYTTSYGVNGLPNGNGLGGTGGLSGGGSGSFYNTYVRVYTNPNLARTSQCFVDGNSALTPSDHVCSVYSRPAAPQTPVQQPPTASLTASPATIVQGNSSALTHVCGNATSASISYIGAVSASSGTSAVAPQSTATYTLTCSNEAGSTQSSATVTVITYTPLPNLSADAPPAIEVLPGIPVTLSVRARNTGGGTTGAPFNAMMLRYDDIGGPATIVRLFSGGEALGIPNGYPANYSEVISASYTPPDSKGVRYYRLCVDYDPSWNGTIAETNEADNCSGYGTMTIKAQPNLTADTPPNLTTTFGQPITLAVTARNNGNAGTGAPFRAMMLRTDYPGGPETIERYFYGSNALGIPNGYPANFSETITAPFTPADARTYYYRLCVDADANWATTIPESNENDNCSGFGTITVLAQSNLTADTPPDLTGVEGTPMTLSVIAQNNGGGATGAPFRAMMLRYDDIGGPATIVRLFSGGEALGIPNGYPANFSEAVTATYTPPDTKATRYYRLCVDLDPSWTGTISETNENDNCSGYGTLTVSPQTRPVPTCSFSANPSDSVPSTLTWSSTNATSCTGGGFSTGGATSGSESVSTAGSYTLSCTGAGGSCSESLTLGGGSCTSPSGEVTATPTRVRTGQTSTITYTASGITTSCTLSGPGVSETKTAKSCSVPSGSVTTGPIETQSTFILTCDGTERARTVVNVIPKFQEF